MPAINSSHMRPPGVYFQRSDTPPMAIEAARTDVAGFVGIAERGPLHEAVRVDSWHQFQSQFGNDYLPHAYMPDAVRGFFANGGQSAWIVRVGHLDRTADLRPAIDIVNEHGHGVLRVRARHQGLAGSRIAVRVTPLRGDQFHLTVLVDDQEFEYFRNLSLSRPKNPEIESRWAPDVVNSRLMHRESDEGSSGSHLIELQDIAVGSSQSNRVVGLSAAASTQRQRDVGRPSRTKSVMLQGSLVWQEQRSQDPARSELKDMTWRDFVGDEADEVPRGLRVFKTVDQPGLIAIPDAVWQPDSTPARHIVQPVGCARVRPHRLEPLPVSRRPFQEHEVRQIQQQLLLHCAQLKDRFAVLDAPASLSPAQIALWADRLRSHEGQFGAIYYPWIACPSRLDTVRWLPPSGHVCGVYARVDLSRGVHAAPANEVVQEARGVQRAVDSDDHGQLNQEHVNVIVATANRGIRVMGARTLVHAESAHLWRNVSVRRLLMMLEESIEEQSHWLVHQGNTQQARMDLERVIRQFLHQQWQQGRLNGESPEAAFRVVCDETNNPPEVHQAARLVCDITVSPPAPSEFITVRIGDQSSSANWRLGGDDV